MQSHYKGVLYIMVATSNMCIFKLKLVKIKLKIQFFRHPGHISNAQ